MSKGSGNTRGSSSKSPSALALSAGASSATTSMKVGGVTPELARARKELKEEIGHYSSPVRKASFDEKTRTLTLDVYMKSEERVETKNGWITNKRGVAGTTEVVDSNKVGMNKMRQHVHYSPLADAGRLGQYYADAGLRPARVIIKTTYVSPEKWDSVSKAYKKKWQKLYGK